jgi:two-component system CheB/CheR fusion protein
MLGVGMQLGRVFERAGLQEHLLCIADQMQHHIAQDLHDDVGQELTGLALKAETMAEAFDTMDSGGAQLTGNGAAASALRPLPADVKHRCSALAVDILETTQRAQGKIRNLARRILPIELELNSLPGALRRLCDDAGRGARLSCEFRNSHPEETFEGRIAGQLYRIAQEAVANAIRHAQASCVRIELAKKRGHTLLSVVDDGQGMPAGAGAASGVGLRIMRYRAGLIGATLEIAPGPGGTGTAIICRLPADDPPSTVRKRRRVLCKPKS